VTRIDADTDRQADVAPDPTPDQGQAPVQVRRWRRRLRWPAIGAVVIAVGTSGWLWAGNTSTGAAPTAAGPVATATVERATMVATRSWDGRLDYGAPFRVTSPIAGTITRLAEQGAQIKRGEELFRIDERPVILLYGDVPMYRNLGPDAAGADVRQLEANLAKLGYGGFTVDRRYTGTTAEAVRSWQADVGAEPTGVVSRGEVVFVPEPGMVDSLRATVGQVVGPGTGVVDITGSDLLVSLEVPADDRDLLEVDTEVSVVLPEGGEVAGTVSAATTASAAGSGVDAAGNNGELESVVQLEVTVAERVPEELAGEPVDVVVATDERTDVLRVPVNALLALAEGGYGLEVVATDGSTSIVPVDTGLFADGMVEINSAEVTEGMVIGVAGR
jgi:peptidoglycan hydrolase-like protein with peptidoglycan-binding domain